MRAQAKATVLAVVVSISLVGAACTGDGAPDDAAAEQAEAGATELAEAEAEATTTEQPTASNTTATSTSSPTTTASTTPSPTTTASTAPPSQPPPTSSPPSQRTSTTARRSPRGTEIPIRPYVAVSGHSNTGQIINDPGGYFDQSVEPHLWPVTRSNGSYPLGGQDIFKWTSTVGLSAWTNVWEPLAALYPPDYAWIHIGVISGYTDQEVFDALSAVVANSGLAPDRVYVTAMNDYEAYPQPDMEMRVRQSERTVEWAVENVGVRRGPVLPSLAPDEHPPRNAHPNPAGVAKLAAPVTAFFDSLL